MASRFLLRRLARYPPPGGLAGAASGLGQVRRQVTVTFIGMGDVKTKTILMWSFLVPCLCCLTVKIDNENDPHLKRLRFENQIKQTRLESMKESALLPHRD